MSLPTPRPSQSKAASGTLIQFAKWPELGRVKTRLAVALGDDGALAAHIELTLAVLENLLSTGRPVDFWWDRPEPDDISHARPLLDRMAAANVRQASQSGRDLGERMSRALSAGLQQASMAVIVGSDCPSVDPDYIEKAFASLSGADVVLGPSNDGGFVLIGVSCELDNALTGIEWGTSKALQQTVLALEAKGFQVVQLEPRWDVDEPDEWHRFLTRR